MNINLIINNETRGFTSPFIPAIKLKNTITIGETITKNVNDPGNFDIMADYIADIFGKQFTADEVLDGLSSADMIKEFTNCVTAVTGELNTKIEALADKNPNE